jgi:hypothetical protein
VIDRVQYAKLTATTSYMQLTSKEHKRKVAELANEEENHGDIPTPRASFSKPAATLIELQAFFSRVNEDPVALAISAERSISALRAQKSALKREYLPFSHPHRVPLQSLQTAARMTQACMHTFMFVIGIRMDHAPEGSWEVSELTRCHVSAVAEAASEVLQALSKELRHTAPSGSAEAALNRLDYAVKMHAKASAEAVARQTVVGADAGGHAMPVAAVLLLYAGAWLADHLRILHGAALDAFLSRQGQGTAAAREARAGEIPALGLGTTPEDALARVWQFKPSSEQS